MKKTTTRRRTRRGIAAGGNWIVDLVKTVDHWPEQDGLALISGQVAANGGGPYNVLKDLARLRVRYPLEGVGLLGDDAHGAFILGDCRTHGIDTRQLHRATGRSTGYTDVVTVRGTGRRTFFHHPGANASLNPAHFDFDALRARHFHLGYMMLLDRLDAPGPDGRARAAGLLRRARAAGLTTSVDCVSSFASGFASVVRPVLPEIDVFFANDYEAERLTGLELGRGDGLRPAEVARAAEQLLRDGVRRWVVVHFPEGAFAAGSDGQRCWQPSVALPPSRIVGANGAGDALAAGVLHGWHEGWPLGRSLSLGVAVAASCLLDGTCSAGIRPLSGCLALARRYGWRPFTGFSP